MRQILGFICEFGEERMGGLWKKKRTSGRNKKY